MAWHRTLFENLKTVYNAAVGNNQEEGIEESLAKNAVVAEQLASRGLGSVVLAENTTLGVDAGAALTGTSRCNVAVGTHALRNAKNEVTFSVAIGNATLAAAAAGSFNNVGIGQEALKALTTGNANTAVGVNALFKVTTGTTNTAVGNTALEQMTGSKSTGVGSGAGFAATATAIVAVGYEALGGTIYTSGPKEDEPEISATAEGTVAVGAFALNKLEGGAGNTAVGWNALFATTSGAKNTAVGDHALYQNKTGAKNTCVGARAGANNTAGSGNVFLGAEAGEESGTESNRLYIANNFTSTPLILGTFPNELLQFNAAEIGFYKHTPTAQKKVAAAASSLLTVETLANSLRRIMIETGLVAE